MLLLPQNINRFFLCAVCRTSDVQASLSTTSSVSATGEKPRVHFKYLDLPLMGRGGAVRNFMLTNGIKFDSQLISRDDWKAFAKKKVMESGENPLGQLPVVIVDGRTLIQHVSIMRYLASIYGLEPSNPWDMYVQNSLADEYIGWRNKWSASAGLYATAGPEAKQMYKKTVPGILGIFDELFDKYKTSKDSPYLTASKSGLWADAAVFTMMYDHIYTELLTAEEIAPYPHMSKLYNAYLSDPSIVAWIKEKAKT